MESAEGNANKRIKLAPSGSDGLDDPPQAIRAIVAAVSAWADLPDACAGHVASYLPGTSRASLAEALTPRAIRAVVAERAGAARADLVPARCVDRVLSYLPRTSRALLAAALTPRSAVDAGGRLVPARPTNVSELLVVQLDGQFEVLDFVEFGRSLAAKVTDADLCDI